LSNSLSLLETTDLCQKIAGKSILIHPVLEERAGDIPIFITDNPLIAARAFANNWV
jgi:CDP-paratose 2-epimerase